MRSQNANMSIFNSDYFIGCGLKTYNGGFERRSAQKRNVSAVPRCGA
jgi:hypothetical protein